MSALLRLPMGCCQREPLGMLNWGSDDVMIAFNIGSAERPAIKHYRYTELKAKNAVDAMAYIHEQDIRQAAREIQALKALKVIPLAIRVTVLRSTSELLGRAA